MHIAWPCSAGRQVTLDWHVSRSRNREEKQQREDKMGRIGETELDRQTSRLVSFDLLYGRCTRASLVVS